MSEFGSLVFITGLSGAGKSFVQSTLEDLGFYCIDNLPMNLVGGFLDEMAGENFDKVGIVVDVRTHDFAEEFPVLFREIKQKHANAVLMFLEATDEVIARRYSETRRPHPISDMPVIEAIRLEREILESIRSDADIVLDTSQFSVHELKAFIVDRFDVMGVERRMLVTIRTFGFKYAGPSNLDLQFDVRFLPNPYFVEGLSEKTGLDEEVVEFLEDSSDYKETVKRLTEFLEFLLPQYEREMKSYLSIGIGCTGGRHRSVAIGEAITRKLVERGFPVELIHRDIRRADDRRAADGSEGLRRIERRSRPA